MIQFTKVIPSKVGSGLYILQDTSRHPCHVRNTTQSKQRKYKTCFLFQAVIKLPEVFFQKHKLKPCFFNEFLTSNNTGEYDICKCSIII